MGWDVSPISRRIKSTDYIKFDWERAGTHEVLAIGNGPRLHGESVYYLAIKQKETGVVFAVVTLAKRTKYDIAIKDISEDAGPLAYDCPAKVFNLLTPTTNPLALEWRAKVAERLANPPAKVKVGDIVEFEKPIEFSDGYRGKRFRFEGGSRFRAVVFDGIYGAYRITNWKSQKYAILQSELIS